MLKILPNFLLEKGAKKFDATGRYVKLRNPPRSSLPYIRLPMDVPTHLLEE
jgi:hypothetical protein